MAAFEYLALDQKSHQKTGVVQAESPRQARASLRDQGLIPLEVKPVAASTRQARFWGAGRERVLILEQLATLLAAGMTLEEVLTVLTEQTERVSSRNAIGAIRARVLEGYSLSSAMAEHPKLFPRLYWASVASGERTGQLDAVLRQLADYAKSRETVGRGLTLALVYPALLLLISLTVVGALIGFVVPRVVNVFEQAGQGLPALTQSLLMLSDGIARFGWMGLIFGLLLVFVTIGLLRSPSHQLVIHRSLLKWPILGRLLRAQQTALLARTLAILTGASVPLVDALKVSADVLGNRAAREDVKEVAKRVSEGVSLSRALEPVPWVSGVARRLIHAGEKGGALASMLDQSAQIEERALASAQSVVLSVIQPVLILLVGMVVLYIVLAIMLPILNMSQLLGGA